MANTETAILAGGCFWGMQECRMPSPSNASRRRHAELLQARQMRTGAD